MTRSLCKRGCCEIVTRNEPTAKGSVKCRIRNVTAMQAGLGVIFACVSANNYIDVQLAIETSQELRMLSRSPSDCRSLLLNLNLNLNRCLSSDCSAIVVLL